MLIPKVIFNRQKPLKLDNATVCICSTVFFPFTAEYTRYSCPLLLSDQIDNTNYFSSKKKVDSDCPKVRRLDSEKKMVCFKLFIFDTLQALKLTTTKADYSLVVRPTKNQLV